MHPHLPFILMALLPLALGCAAARAEEPPPTVPAHLVDRPAELYARDASGAIIQAPTEDLAVARGYAEWADKGELHDGQRITLLTTSTKVRVGEPVRVVHVLEAVEPGHEVYVMGPKAIRGEWVDGTLATDAPPDDSYDGAVMTSPWADFNYEVTVYSFDTAGTHTIQWKGGGHSLQDEPLALESNTLRVVVTD